MVYVGMDIHRKRTPVAVIDERGEELSNRNFRNDPAELSPMLMTLEQFSGLISPLTTLAPIAVNCADPRSPRGPKLARMAHGRETNSTIQAPLP